MKNVKIFSLSLMCAFCTNMQAQTSELEYRPFIEDGKNWSVQNGLEMYNSYNYFIKSDTVIDAKTWKQTIRNQSEYIYEDYYASIREENKKVYAIEAETNTPHLIYDFGLKVGDVVQLVRSKNSSFRWIEKSDVSDIEDGNCVGTMVLTKIDVARTLGNGSAQEADAPFRRFTFNTSWTDGNGEPNTVIWVEGIGSDAGPFMPWHNYTELKTKEMGYYSVVCKKNKKTIFWGDEFYIGLIEYTKNDETNTWSEYTDPESKVVYTYDPNGTTASVKEGFDMPNIVENFDERIAVVSSGSPDASGNIAILDKIAVDGKEYIVTDIGIRAFYNCKDIASFIIPATVTTIGAQAFYGCNSLRAVSIPETVTTIEESSFEACSSLTDIELPQNLSSIEIRAFNNSGLKTIIIPSGITSIGASAFYNQSLVSVVSLIENPFSCRAFGGRTNAESIFAQAILYVPKGCKKKYESCTDWYMFKNIEEIEVTGINDAERLMDKGQMINDKRGGVYDLQGRRLTQKPEKGVYIENGRKRVVK